MGRSDHQRDHQADYRGARILQSRETRRVHQHRRHTVPGGNDPPWRRTQRHPREAQEQILDIQLYAAVECIYRSHFLSYRMRLFLSGTIQSGGCGIHQEFDPGNSRLVAVDKGIQLTFEFHFSPISVSSLAVAAHLFHI